MDSSVCDLLDDMQISDSDNFGSYPTQEETLTIKPQSGEGAPQSYTFPHLPPSNIGPMRDILAKQLTKNKTKFTSKEDEQLRSFLTCSLCKLIFALPVRTMCNHVFCRMCIEMVLDFDKGCPSCGFKSKTLLGVGPFYLDKDMFELSEDYVKFHNKHTPGHTLLPNHNARKNSSRKFLEDNMTDVFPHLMTVFKTKGKQGFLCLRNIERLAGLTKELQQNRKPFIWFLSMERLIFKISKRVGRITIKRTETNYISFKLDPAVIDCKAFYQNCAYVVSTFRHQRTIDQYAKLEDDDYDSDGDDRVDDEDVRHSKKEFTVEEAAAIGLMDIACPICCEVMIIPSKTICGHVFCRECIIDRMSPDSECPICGYSTADSLSVGRIEPAYDVYDKVEVAMAYMVALLNNGKETQKAAAMIRAYVSRKVLSERASVRYLKNAQRILLAVIKRNEGKLICIKDLESLAPPQLQRPLFFGELWSAEKLLNRISRCKEKPITIDRTKGKFIHFIASVPDMTCLCWQRRPSRYG